jgi:hypothetical protein
MRMGDERSQQFHWVDRHPALDVARKVGGIEYTHMVMRSEVPPAPVYANSSASDSCWGQARSILGLLLRHASYCCCRSQSYISNYTELWLINQFIR